ncbi:hypothetical protein [Arthrobacter sp. NPDC093139]|uniref:hypothetical protein n=1 Tax=Arthrobacter sp. NPDC093139 TaxID=3363945 RepID=UPI0037FAAAF2
MADSAMYSTVISHAHSSEDEFLDVQDIGLAHEPTSDAGAHHGKGPGIAPAGQTESLIPEIFPVYAFI